MNRTKIAQLYADAEALGGSRVTVAGWVKSVRDMKNFGFVTINDGSCFRDLQVVMNRDDLANYDEIAHQNVSAALICTGTVKLTPDAPQPFELTAETIEVEGPSAPDYPLQKKRATVEFLRTQQHLRPRTNLFRAVFRIRSVAAAAIHRFFQDRGFVYVNTPIITTSDCEGAGEMFRVTTFDPAHAPLTDAGEVDWSQDFFGKAASLTVSGQLNAENFAMAFGDVYTFGPTFRAENSNTTRHATSDFARVTYTEAIEILEAAVAAGHTFEYPVSWDIDLQTEHERFLTEEHFKCPTFVTDYPAEIKAFYMRLNDDGKTVAAADCLVPGIGEIIGGSQREERLDVLERRIAELGMDASQYKYYLDLRRFGTCKHAGFGLGFERLVMYLTGVGNIRDVIPHPRTVGNAEF